MLRLPEMTSQYVRVALYPTCALPLMMHNVTAAGAMVLSAKRLEPPLTWGRVHVLSEYMLASAILMTARNEQQRRVPDRRIFMTKAPQNERTRCACVCVCVCGHERERETCRETEISSLRIHTIADACN
jgi:hypothetical protein